MTTMMTMTTMTMMTMMTATKMTTTMATMMTMAMTTMTTTMAKIAMAHDGCVEGNIVGDVGPVALTVTVTLAAREMVAAMAAVSATAMVETKAVDVAIATAHDGCVEGNCVGNAATWRVQPW